MCHKKEERFHGLKKKEFPQKYEFLADIVGKCILCKDSAHDSVSDIQLKVMTAIVKRHQLNYGAILLSWMGKKIQEKSPKKVFFGRFISILLKKILKEQIKEGEGDPLNVNKRITQRLFSNWERLLPESGETKSQGKQSSQAKEDSTSVPAPQKGKRKLEEVQKQSEEHSQGSSAPVQQKKKKAVKVSTPEPTKDAEEMAVKVPEPEPQEEPTPSPILMEAPIEGEHGNSDVEIIATGRNAERSHTYDCLYSFLPLMPFHRALCHLAWTQLFWTYKVYPNVQVLAEAYPFQIHFAHRLLTNQESGGLYNKLTYIPLSFLVQISYSFSSVNPNTSSPSPVQNSDPTPHIVQSPQPSPDPTFSAPISEPTPSSVLHLVQRSPPSTSTSIPPSTSSGPSSDPNSLLQQILDQLSLRPTTSGLTELTCHLEMQFHNSIEASTNTIHDRIDDIVNGANQLPAIIGNELKRKLKDIVQSITAKDQIFLGEIQKQKKAIEALNDNQLSSSTSVIKQIFELKDMIRAQNERSDTALALVHQQQQTQDVILQQQRADFAASQSQMQEVLEAVQQLSDQFNDANKGEKAKEVKGKGKGKREDTEIKSNSPRGRSQGGGRGFERGRTGPRSHQGRGRSRYSPPRHDYFSRGQGSSSRSASVAEDLRRWDEQLRIKEEAALEREEEALRKEEEERIKLLRRPRDRDRDRI